jgi:hypothetical protein
MPAQALRVPEGWGSRFQESRFIKVVRLSSLRSGRLYLPENIPGTHFCQRLSRPQGHSAAGRISQWKIPKTPSGIETATFRLLAQFLIQLRHRVPRAPVSCGIQQLIYLPISYSLPTLILSCPFLHNKCVYISRTLVTVSLCLTLLDLITLTILGDQYASRSSPECNFLHSRVTSSIPNIFLSTLFSNTFRVRPSLTWKTTFHAQI